MKYHEDALWEGLHIQESRSDKLNSSITHPKHSMKLQPQLTTRLQPIRDLKPKVLAKLDTVSSNRNTCK